MNFLKLITWHDSEKETRNQLFRSFWVVARHISLIILLVAVFGFVIFSIQQGIDIVQALSETPSYWIWSYLALACWSLTLWYCCTFLLMIKQISYDKNFTQKNQIGIEAWLNFLPPFIGISPFVFFFFKAPFYTSQSFLFLVFLVIEIIIFAIVFTKYKKIIKKVFFNLNWLDKISTEKQSFSSIFYFKDVRNVFIGFVIFTCLLFVASLLSVESSIATGVGPAAVLIFGLLFLTAVISLFEYNNIAGRRPVFIYLAAFCFVLSFWNDNSDIRLSKEPLEKRVKIENDFETWLHDIKIDSSQTKKDTIVPVIFIATEGGGIRALTWTALVLKRLEEKYKNFHRNVYGISGVSGGGVGSVFFTSYLFDSLSAGNCGGCINQHFEKSIKNDFLSDVLAAALFQDNLQKIIPVGIPAFNRSRRLEDAWGKAYFENINTKTFEAPFNSLWKNSKIRLPRLFINGTLAESGQKTIVSYPCLTGDSTKIFDDEIDVFARIQADMPVKTAASMCSRFPYITSGGLISTPSGEKIGHVLDGGYKENTGLETIWQMLIRLKPVLEKYVNKDSTKKRTIFIQPIVLFIKNSPSTEVADKGRKVITKLHEVSIPIVGFLNAWDRRTPTLDILTKKVFNEIEDQDTSVLKYKYYKIDLDRSTPESKNLALGWYFSEKSFQIIQRQADKLFVDKPAEINEMDKELSKYFH